MTLKNAKLTLFVLIAYFSNQYCYAEKSDTCENYNCYIQLAQSGQDESSFIKKNQEAVKSSTNRALFTVYRIKCLNTGGINGLNACNKALSIDPNVAALRKRKSTLSAQLYPKRRVIKVQKRPVPPPKKHIRQKPKNKPLVPQKPRITKTIKKVKQVSLKETIARKHAKKTVTDIQQLLIKLGFNVSSADGIAGKNTRKAIDNFLKVSGSKTPSKTDKTLLNELQQAYSLHKQANTKYKTAVTQREDAKLKEAIITIEDSLKILPWHQPLLALRAEINEQIMTTRNEEQEKIARQTSLKTPQKETLLAQKQRNIENEAKNKLIKTLLVTAKLELSKRSFSSSLSTITKGLKLSPQDQQFLRLKEEALDLQEKYALNQSIQEITEDTNIRLKNKEYDKASILISKGLTMSPTSQPLLKLKRNLAEIEKRSEKLSKIILTSKEHLIKQDFTKTIDVANEGLLIDPNNTILLDIKNQANSEKEKLAIKISSRKQKSSNFLALMLGKKKELLAIEKDMNLENDLLLQDAQTTLTKYWAEARTED